ncbi:MAG: response regulator [Sedimentisphaerales bacterium]|nr:response regulator [Sedimentisphaerales bacterium]
MSEVIKQNVHRILVIDDNPNIHKDFLTILTEEQDNTKLDELHAEVFGETNNKSVEKISYELDFASQGQEGYEKVKEALSQNRPYELAFVDMRMPPGWDGLKTIESIWEVDKNIQVVICTAYSDYSWGEITQRLGKSENLLILKKPFDCAEVSQLASALTEKWNLAKKASMKLEELEQLVQERAKELIEKNNQLKLEIAEREQMELKLAEMIRKVESANKELKEFASIVSHDLKAPLRGVKTLAQWIMEDCGDRLDTKATEQMNLLMNRVDRIYSLIDGVLKYSKVGQDSGEHIPLNLDTFIPEVINMVVPPEHIKVTIENQLPSIICEETHIMQVFQNLISNAIKYNDKQQGWIKISCTEEGDFWKFSVADNGPGIAEEHFERIFRMFHALKQNENIHGTGVGLTVVKKVVELYGGRIWIESEVGKGSTFFFTFPKMKSAIKNEELVTHSV